MPDGGSGAQSLAQAAAERTLIIACGALAREIGQLVGRGALGHVALTCLPALLHNSPEKIPGAVRKAVLEAKGHYGRILVGYADCGTGGELDKVCRELDVERIDGPHCYSFFIGNEDFAKQADDEFRNFYLTDFLARQFDAIIIKSLGLDRWPELRDDYFRHYEKLVYLAQTEDPALTEKAKAAARRLDLKFERRYVGYGDLTAFVDDAAAGPMLPDMSAAKMWRAH